MRDRRTGDLQGTELSCFRFAPRGLREDAGGLPQIRGSFKQGFRAPIKGLAVDGKQVYKNYMAASVDGGGILFTTGALLFGVHIRAP